MIRGHKQWLQEDYGISDEKFEQIVRGYIRNGKIALYKGKSFNKLMYT